MRRLRLTLAVGDYDITRPLIDGAVQPQGVELLTLACPSPQRHWRMLTHAEFDVAELSLGSYVALRGRGHDDLVAIPVFPHRRFRHGYAFVAAASGVRQPADLAGQTVGVRSWQTTAGVWLRGILAEHHGLALQRVRWLAQDGEDVPLALPDGLVLERVAEGDDVTERCARSEIAGLIYPELPRQLRAGDGRIRRLFADPKRAEQAYFAATGIFPIMHVVAVRAGLLAEHRWLARNLFDAFEAAKRLAVERLEDPRTVSLAWLRALQEEERAILGPDPWRYGLDTANRHTLDRFLTYARQQGVTSHALTPEDLFDPTTTARPPAYV